MLIGISGRKGCGKSLVASLLVEEHGFIERSFADPIKKAAVTLFQIRPCQLEGDMKEKIDERHGLSPRQKIGTDMFRNMVDEDFWVSHFKRWYEGMHEEDVVVPDVRFQNELDCIRALGGIVIRLHRSTGHGRHQLKDDHISETRIGQLLNIDHDIENNADIGALIEKVRCIIRHHGKSV